MFSNWCNSSLIATVPPHPESMCGAIVVCTTHLGGAWARTVLAYPCCKRFVDHLSLILGPSKTELFSHDFKAVLCTECCKFSSGVFQAR